MYYTDLVTYVNLLVDLFHTTLFWARTLCCHRHCFGLLTCLSYIVLEFIFVVDILPTYIRLFIFSLRHVCVLPRTERLSALFDQLVTYFRCLNLNHDN